MTVQTQEATLRHMRGEVYEVNHANGWFDDERSFDDDIALNHSEVSEMFEAYRSWGLGDATTSGGDFDRLPKPEGFGSECADVLIRLLDMSLRRKIEFSWATLTEIIDSQDYDPWLGIGSHIAKLHKLISCITPETSLDPTLSYLVTLCRHQGINLRSEYERKIAYNRTRGYRHGGKRI